MLITKLGMCYNNSRLINITEHRRQCLTGALRLALASRISDRDDFRRLILTSDDGTEEILFHKDVGGGMVCEREGEQTHLLEDAVLDSVENLILQGFSSVTCECWSRNTHIDLPPDGRGNMKIRYSQPVAPKDMDAAKPLIDPEEASELLRAIDITTAEGHIKADMRRKYVQIDGFVKLIQPLLSRSAQKRKVFILDCGCGKSYLSFVMNYVLREKLGRSSHFFCIDTSSAIINKCLQIRGELGYDNMEFCVSEIRNFEPREKVDIVCSLHACDTASDEAIARGIQLEAPFLLIVPCCQHEVIGQLKDHPLKALSRHGVYKARLADLLTDAMRTLTLEAAGYKVRVAEYVSPMYTPKNTLIQAEKIQDRNRMAMDQYLELKAMFGNILMELERMLPELFS